MDLLRLNIGYLYN